MDIYQAKTHPSEYLIHKYWARKPHNVVSAFIKKYAKHDRIVLDPFCGSCVTNIEAAKLGFDTIGVDINPIATLIGKVSLSKIDYDLIYNTFEDLLSQLKSVLTKYYSIEGGLVRYCTHTLILRCTKCDNTFLITESKKKGKKYICNKCGELLSGNVSTIHSTNIISIVTTKKEIITNNNILEEQTKFAYEDISSELGTDPSVYDFPMIENRRILTYPKTSTRSYFTTRNFCSLSFIADLIHKLTPIKLKNFFWVCFTSSVAQCSRLIPYRNNLTTGGPAWSIPGFWIPSKHLECNPIIHFENRFKKVYKGLTSLHPKLNFSTKSIFITSGFKDSIKKIKKEEIGYVFADPPYGDSVPYLEFSAIWNSWLLKKPSLSKEIVVSDSKARKKRWNQYKKEIAETVMAISNMLKEGTCFTFTFNQLSLKAWNALLHCAECSNLVFHAVDLVLPAVIPSKARFSVKGSYIGDYYITFVKSNKKILPGCDEFAYVKKLKKIYSKVASTRSGKIAYPHIVRVAVGIILREKCPSSFTEIANEFINKYFTVQEQPYYNYNSEFIQNRSILEEIDSSIKNMLKDGPGDLWNIVEDLLNSYEFYLAPEISEILASLERTAIKKNKKYYLNESKQLTLF